MVADGTLVVEQKAVKEGPVRAFHSLRKKGDNPLAHNLTELCAAEAVDRGFMLHNDWLAHVNRYAYAMKQLMRTGVQTVLDVGCGNLQLPYYAHRNRIPPVKAYWGLDLRAQQAWLEAAQWATPMTLVQLDLVQDEERLEALHEWPGAFDLVTCFEVFEHVPRGAMQERLVRNLYRWTAMGGLCLFSTPNAGVSDSTAANHIGPDGVSRERTYADKLELVQRVGFEVEASYGTFCGSRRIPAEAQAGRALEAAKAFLPHALYTTVIAAAYPELSNNALMVLRRPRNH